MDNTETGITKISDINADSCNVNLIAKIISALNVKEFNRNDGSIGRVVNLTVADETGNVRVTLWDDKTELIKNKDIKVGQTVQISGYVKNGYFGLEVNVGKNGVIAGSNETMDTVASTLKIKDIKNGMGDINLFGRIVEISDMKTFSKKDGTSGSVCNITIGDDTGKICVTLWDQNTEFTKDVTLDDSVEIINGYAKENNFNQQVEIQIEDRSTIKKSTKTVEHKENFTPISEIVPGENYSIEGTVSDIGAVREFTRGDGTLNMVANIEVTDGSGHIRVALWGDHALVIDELDIDSPVQIMDAYSKIGYNDQIELSVGNRSRVVVF
ncbi:replication factor A [Patescibacteria group bacterium]|nr:replication factor A [Patescibacteria group bacterium]